MRQNEDIIMTSAYSSQQTKYHAIKKISYSDKNWQTNLTKKCVSAEKNKMIEKKF